MSLGQDPQKPLQCYALFDLIKIVFRLPVRHGEGGVVGMGGVVTQADM